MDPPYWRRKLYRYNFSDEDFAQLEQHLHKIRGRFLLSLDDHPEVRKLFGGWLITPVQIVYTAQRRPKQRYGEVLISNYELPEQREKRG
jgi:DNA adenine methylase